MFTFLIHLYLGLLQLLAKSYQAENANNLANFTEISNTYPHPEGNEYFDYENKFCIIIAQKLTVRNPSVSNDPPCEILG